MQKRKIKIFEYVKTSSIFKPFFSNNLNPKSLKTKKPTKINTDAKNKIFEYLIKVCFIAFVSLISLCPSFLKKSRIVNETREIGAPSILIRNESIPV
tara:strand:+ start:491 stop:781 length:291 start_codon:yes stop_codon:yes gene_type:complete